MARQYLARVGVMGYVGRFATALPLDVSRGSRVVCRTERGLEVAELLSDVEGFFVGFFSMDKCYDFTAFIESCQGRCQAKGGAR